MIETGNTLTVLNDHIDICGNIILQSGQQMIVRELKNTDGFWSGDYWIPERVIGVLLEDHCGVYHMDCFCEYYIGKRVCKGSISKQEPNNKPFKSGLIMNTVKGVIIHPILNIPAYTFEEDDSYVECRRCIVVNEFTEQQKKILKLIKENPNTLIITAEQGIGKAK